MILLKKKKSCVGKQKVACLQEYCDKETGENFEGDYLRRTQHTWKASLNDIIKSNWLNLIDDWFYWWWLHWTQHNWKKYLGDNLWLFWLVIFDDWWLRETTRWWGFWRLIFDDERWSLMYWAKYSWNTSQDNNWWWWVNHQSWARPAMIFLVLKLVGNISLCGARWW